MIYDQKRVPLGNKSKCAFCGEQGKIGEKRYVWTLKGIEYRLCEICLDIHFFYLEQKKKQAEQKHLNIETTTTN